MVCPRRKVQLFYRPRTKESKPSQWNNWVKPGWRPAFTPVRILRPACRSRNRLRRPQSFQPFPYPRPAFRGTAPPPPAASRAEK